MTYHPFSDFALHHVGSGLADGINQGAAGPDQFRTAPLWGLGQRLFFLHDGRTADVLQAIEPAQACWPQCWRGPDKSWARMFRSAWGAVNRALGIVIQMGKTAARDQLGILSDAQAKMPTTCAA